MFELSGVKYEEVLEQGDSILVRVIASSSYRNYTVYISINFARYLLNRHLSYHCRASYKYCELILYKSKKNS